MLKPFVLAAMLAATAFADESPPATLSSSPTSSPTTAGAATVELTGYLAPIDAQEFKPKLKQFTSSLTVTQVVPHGSPVKAGQVLITFDLTQLDQEILEATSDLEVAKAGLTKAESDTTEGEKADASTLEERTDALADAKLTLAWWRDIDGPDFLKRLDQAVQSAQDGIDDQEDELDQLRKMYKSEELTNATADIVVKRAVRSLDRSKHAFEVTQHAADKQKAIDYTNQQQTVERAVDAAERALTDAKATIAQSTVTRAAALLKARVALRDAQKKLSEIEQDKQLVSDVRAKTDGVVFYGAFADGAWQGAKDDAIKVGEKTETTKPILTVVNPAKLRVVAKVEEAKLFDVREGQTATITPAALPELKLTGTLAAREPTAGADGSFEQKIDLGSVDPRLMAGMKVKIEVPKAGK